MIRISFFLVAFAFGCTPSIAGILVTSATRSIDFSIQTGGMSPISGGDSSTATSGVFASQFGVGSSFVFDSALTEIDTEIQSSAFLASGFTETHVQDISMGNATSLTDIGFTLTESYHYSLTATLRTFGDFGGGATADASLTFGSVLTPNSWVVSGTSGGPQTIHSSGTLLAGDYLMLASARTQSPMGFSNMEAEYDVSVQFSKVNPTVPEPGSLSMAGFLLGGLLLRKRSRGRSQSRE